MTDTPELPSGPHPPLFGGTVLACVDDSTYAESVCDFAAWSATLMGSPLCLLHIIEPVTGGAGEPKNLSGAIGFGAREDLLEERASLDARRARVAMDRGRLLLDAARSRIAVTYPALDSAVTPIDVRLRHGDLVDTLQAMESGIRMVVVGKRGADSASAHGHLGANLERIIRSVGKPILLAQQSFAPPERLMFAWDGSQTARKGLERVADSPLLTGIPCHLVYVGADRKEVRESLAGAKAMLEADGREAPTAILRGDADDALLEYQRQNRIDLLIMGAYGHSRIRHLILGSTTTAVLRRCTVSVMVLR